MVLINAEIMIEISKQLEFYVNWNLCLSRLQPCTHLCKNFAYNQKLVFILIAAAQDGCNALSSTGDGLITGVGKTNLIPNIQATPGGTSVDC